MQKRSSLVKTTQLFRTRKTGKLVHLAYQFTQPFSSENTSIYHEKQSINSDTKNINSYCTRNLFGTGEYRNHCTAAALSPTSA